MNSSPNRPLQSIVIFPEILSGFSQANAQTKALTNGIIKMLLLTLSITSLENYKSLKICRKINYDLESFQAGINSIRPRSPHCCNSP